MTVKLTIEFDNEKAARHFALWLCEAGEQKSALIAADWKNPNV